MIWHANLMQFALDRANVIVMTSLDMVQPESIVLQDPDDIVVRPVEDPSGHSGLHAGESVVLNLNRRRNGLICGQFIPKVEIFSIWFLIEWRSARALDFCNRFHVSFDRFLQVEVDYGSRIALNDDIELQRHAKPRIAFLKNDIPHLASLCCVHARHLNIVRFIEPNTRKSLERLVAQTNTWLLDGFQDLKIFFEGFDEGLVVDGGGRVILRRDFQRPATRHFGLVQLTMRFADGLQLKGQPEFAHDVFHRKSSECCYTLGLNDLYLPIEERRVKLYLARERVAIAWWSVLDDVGDVDICARNIDGSEQVVENSSRRSAKRSSGLRLILSGRLADEHDIRIMTPLSNDAKVLVLPSEIRQPSRERHYLIPYRFHLFVFLVHLDSIKHEAASRATPPQRTSRPFSVAFYVERPI